MLSNALDDECVGRSPCHECPWHLHGLNKNRCVNQCERLAAYRDSEPWEGLDIPVCDHGGKETVMTKSEVGGQESEVRKIAGVAIEEIIGQKSMIDELVIKTPAPVIPAQVDKKKKREYHKTTIQPGPVKQARGLLNKEADGICLIDGCDIKDRLIRGLCPKHYQAWRKGCIKHPILGKFTVWQAKSRRSEARGRKSEIRDQKPKVGKDIERGNLASQKATPIKEKKQMSKDSKASYYDAGGIETLDIIKAKLTPEQYKGYLLGCSLKYQCRLMHKFDDNDRIRDAEKAANYSQWLVEAFKGRE